MKKHALRTLLLCIAALILKSCSEKEVEIIDPEFTTFEVTEKTYQSINFNLEYLNNGDGIIYSKGVCWNTNELPTIDNNLTETIDTSKNIIHVTELEPNKKYFFRAFLKSDLGIVYSDELNITLWLNIPETNLTDIDNNTYETVRIGDQIWMKENLKTIHYQNGDNIANLKMYDDKKWLEKQSGAYCSYNDENENASKYGLLYNGFAILDSRSICPAGWHVPTKKDWDELIYYIGGYYTGGATLKAKTGWESSQEEFNLSGFSALPGGFRWHPNNTQDYTIYSEINELAIFASQEYEDYCGIDNLWFIKLSQGNDYIYFNHNITRTNGMSVRCIKD